MLTKDKVKVSTTTSGIGIVSLGQAFDGFQSFSVLGSGSIETYYLITCDLEWEIGVGTYKSSNSTLDRKSIISSSNNGQRIALYGTSTVRVIDPGDNDFNYNANGNPPQDGAFLVGSGDRIITRKLTTSDISNGLGFVPYDARNPNGYLNKNSLPVTIIYETGKYFNPPWIEGLDPSKVRNVEAVWNANRIQDNAVSNVRPQNGDVLVWNGVQWEPKVVTGVGGSSSGGEVITYTLSSTAETSVDSTPVASGECIKYIAKAKYSSSIHSTEILVNCDGTDAYMTEYAQIYSSSNLIQFRVDLNSSNIRLLATATNSNTSLKLLKVVL